jgi:hypothetical protein
MFGRLSLGVPYELNLVEPRYQHVIEHVMRDHPAESRQGGPIDRDAVLVHINRGPLERSTPAVLVQVLRCQITLAQEEEEESTATTTTTTHVVLLPFAHVWLEKASMSKDELVHVQCLKMGKGVTADMNRLARQEALANVMDQLAVDVLTNDDLQDAYYDDSDSDDDDSVSTSSSFSSELGELENLILGE